MVEVLLVLRWNLACNAPKGGLHRRVSVSVCRFYEQNECWTVGTRLVATPSRCKSGVASTKKRKQREKHGKERSKKHVGAPRPQRGLHWGLHWRVAYKDGWVGLQMWQYVKVHQLKWWSWSEFSTKYNSENNKTASDIFLMLAICLEVQWFDESGHTLGAVSELKVIPTTPNQNWLRRVQAS